MAFTATLFLLSACSNDKSDDSNNPVDNTAPVAAQFTAGIVTRAFDQQWEENDFIGVSGTSGDVEYSNVAYHYTTAGDGAFSAVIAREEIYFQVPAPTTFTAYYPFSVWSIETSTPLLIASTESQKAQKTFDFLYGTGTGSKATPTVTFQFGHSMSKCIFNIKPGDNITFADITGGSSTLGGVTHDGEFNPSTGVATATGAVTLWDMSTNATAIDVTTPVGSEVRTYSLILYPQTMAGLTYSAVIDGEPYTATIGTGLAIEAGKSYSYNITVNKTGLAISAATITEWIGGNGPGGTDVDAEM